PNLLSGSPQLSIYLILSQYPYLLSNPVSGSSSAISAISSILLSYISSLSLSDSKNLSAIYISPFSTYISISAYSLTPYLEASCTYLLRSFNPDLTNLFILILSLTEKRSSIFEDLVGLKSSLVLNITSSIFPSVSILRIVMFKKCLS